MFISDTNYCQFVDGEVTCCLQSRGAEASDYSGTKGKRGPSGRANFVRGDSAMPTPHPVQNGKRLGQSLPPHHEIAYFTQFRKRTTLRTHYTSTADSTRRRRATSRAVSAGLGPSQAHHPVERRALRRRTRDGENAGMNWTKSTDMFSFQSGYTATKWGELEC